MTNLEEFYTSVGSNAEEIIRRLGGNPSLILRFLAMFRSDTSFGELCTALDNNDTDAAFRAAHKLKGVVATLGFQRLYDKASATTEMLRGGALAEAQKARPELEQEYKQVLMALESLNC